MFLTSVTARFLMDARKGGKDDLLPGLAVIHIEHEDIAVTSPLEVSSHLLFGVGDIEQETNQSAATSVNTRPPRIGWKSVTVEGRERR